MVKILGISLGTKNGSNDAMCKEALIAAQEAGAEVYFIHLLDWDIQHCSGCVACSRGLVMGKGNICTKKDEFDDFRDKVLDADGVLFVDPIFECGASGLAHTIMDRFGPRLDRGMNTVAHMIAQNNPNAKDVDPRLLQTRCVSFIGIGGSDWATAIEYDNSILALSGGWTIINNEKFAWSKNIIMEDEKVEKCRQVGRNLVAACEEFAKVKDDPDYERVHKKALWKGDKGICPHCHGKNFYFPEQPSDVQAICMTCGIEGKIEVVDGQIQFVFAPEAEGHAHDLMQGKFEHADDIKVNEGKAIENRKSEKFKASAERIKSYNLPEILPPSKRQ